MLPLFGSTYVCEQTFSVMNKARHRSRLTDQHLRSILRIATTQLTPDFDALRPTTLFPLKCEFLYCVMKKMPLLLKQLEMIEYFVLNVESDSIDLFPVNVDFFNFAPSIEICIKNNLQV